MTKITWFQSPHSKDLPTIDLEMGEAEKLRIILEFYIDATKTPYRPCVLDFAKQLRGQL